MSVFQGNILKMQQQRITNTLQTTSTFHWYSTHIIMPREEISSWQFQEKHMFYREHNASLYSVTTEAHDKVGWGWQAHCKHNEPKLPNLQPAILQDRPSLTEEGQDGRSASCSKTQLEGDRSKRRLQGVVVGPSDGSCFTAGATITRLFEGWSLVALSLERKL